MRTLTLPSGQLFQYVLTGKFKAPSEDWQHEQFFLGEYELIVMTEGILYLSYDGEDFTVNPGEYLLLPPSDSYRKGFRPAYSSFYWLHFAVPQMAGTASPGDTAPAGPAMNILQTGTVPKLEKMVVLMKQLQDCVKSNYPALSLNAMSTSILGELYGQLQLQSPFDTLQPPTRNYKQIHLDIIDYVQLHISRNIKVSEIAEHFNYNEKYLSHLFGELTGVPLKQFILNRKIETANFMLTDTNLPVADIARAVGFLDSHNFARAYKKITGLSPSEYRNAYAKRLLYNK